MANTVCLFVGEALRRLRAVGGGFDFADDGVLCYFPAYDPVCFYSMAYQDAIASLVLVSDVEAAENFARRFFQ